MSLDFAAINPAAARAAADSTSGDLPARAQYVVGAGGRGRYLLHGGPSTMVWGRDDINAALRIVLKPGLALLEFRGPHGRVLDRSRVSCTPAEAAPAGQ